MKEATFLLFVLCALISEILGTLAGFGSSVLFVPLANFFMDFQSVLGVTAVFHLFSNLTKIWLFRKEMHAPTIARIGISSVIFVLIGALFSSEWNSGLMQFILGVFLCFFSAFLFFNPHFHKPAGSGFMIFLGGISGFIAGLLGTGGAIRGIALTSLNLSKEMFIGTSAAIDLAVDFSRGIVYWKNGFIHLDDLSYILALFIVAVAGSWIGKKWLEKIKGNWFRKMVLGFVFLSGLMLLIKHFPV